jgi:transcriptional regulator with XRE-family HTH domain
MNNDTLKLLRIVNGYKQQGVADVLGINQNTYSRLERDPKKITVAQARKLAKFYKVNLEDLLSDKIPVINFGKLENDNQQSGSTAEIALLKKQRDFLRTQNEELWKVLGEKTGVDGDKIRILRNISIYRKRADGATFKEIGKEHKLSGTMVSIICRRIDHILENQKGGFKDYKELLSYKTN